MALTALFVYCAPTFAASAPEDTFDANAFVSAEEYPPGGLITGNLGYGKKFWSAADDPDAHEGSFWKYGYVRPAVQWQTSAVTNRITGYVDFYPISIFGISGGGGVDFRNYENFSGIDCSKYMCNEALYFKFTQAQLIVGAGKFAAIVTGRYDWYQAQSNDRPFYDYMSYLIGRPGTDDLRSLTLLGVYRPSDDWSFGVLGIYQEMVFSEGNNGGLFAIATHNWGPWQASIGAGDYRSDHQALRPSIIGLFKYTLKKSVGL